MRGFVTIATGADKYYKLALNLLRSYRRHATDDVPFAIICDRETEETKEFDAVVLMESANCSYMDKLLLYRYSPYDETIFIDADSLILANPSGLWEDFFDADDVSCYGCIYPLSSDRAWFTYEGCGKYKGIIQHLINLHGGIYFFRKSARSRSIFERAIELAGEYSQYGFRYFDKPADEPVLAMSLAIHHSCPCSKPARVIFLPSYWGKLQVMVDGRLFLNGKEKQIEIVHFATKNTERFLYRYLQFICSEKSPERLRMVCCYVKLKLTTAPIEIVTIIRHNAGKILRKIFPDTLYKWLRKRL